MVNEDTLVVVHCYQGDMANVETMLPKWLHHGCPVLILSPADSPVVIDHPGVECRSAGQVGWNGEHTVDRQLAHFRIIAEYPQKYLLMHDADSVCVSPEIPSYLYQGTDNAFYSNNYGDERIFIPPYFFTQGSMQKMLAMSERAKVRVPPHTDQVNKFIDQYYASLVRCAGLDYRVFPDGFHAFTQSAQDLAIVDFYQVALMYHEVRANGARMLHSVKSKGMLDAVVIARWEHDMGRSATVADRGHGGAAIR